jgi:DNA-binding transcriptional MerR regulator
MKITYVLMGIASVCGILALAIAPVSAGFQSKGFKEENTPSQFLDKLEEQGYDVSAIRAAVEAGDPETAHTLMQQFMEEHRDELPIPPVHRTPPSMGGDMLTTLLDRLEEQGYDISAIRAAIEAGDPETAHTLMQQFMEEHRDEIPAFPDNGDRMIRHMDRLEEQGYDISAIRAAVESGDTETARTLMQQFMEEHRNEWKTPPVSSEPPANKWSSSLIRSCRMQAYEGMQRR